MSAPGAAPTRPEPDRYFPCIDGLRAAAALLVLVFHVAGPTGVNRGTTWVADYTNQFGRLGVSIFFAISGFLLYRPFALAHLGGAPSPRVGPYLRRRFLRIFPAYWLALLGWTVLGSAAVRSGILDHLLLRVSLLQGYSQAKDGNVPLALSGVEVAWTLTIELTFYLVLPLYAWAIRRLGGALGRGQQLTAEWLGLGVLYVIGITGRYLLAEDVLPIGALFPWTDLFAMGMLIAVVRARQKTGGPTPALFRYLGRYPLLGLLLALELVWVVAQLDVARGYAEKSLGDEFARHLCYGFVGFLLLAPLVFGNQDRTTYRRFLRTRPVRWTGEVSYGIYLWHFLVMRLVLERWTDLTFWPLLGATFAVTFVIASLSFVLLERPVQRLRLHRLLPSSGRRPVPGGEDGEGATGPDGRGGGSRAAAPTSTRGGPPP